MKKRNFISLLVGFIVSHKINILISLLLTALLLFFTFLYGYSYHMTTYFLNTAYTIIGITSAVCFLCFYYKYKRLKAITKNISTSLDALPEPTTIIEETYQELLFALLEEYKIQQAKHSQYQKELLDYYRLWVHQIKTPIAALQLLLEADRVQYEEKLQLQQIDQYANMALQYLRMESMANDLLLKPYDIDPLIQDVIKKQAPFFIHKKITLHYKPIQKNIITDEKWFSFVLQQILGNSLKYTPQGSISIYCQDEYLIIADTGIGIHPEDLPRIFERGFTGFNGHKAKQATGIGLYLCKHIMDNLQLPLKITSTAGQGTKVYIGLQQKKLLF